MSETQKKINRPLLTTVNFIATVAVVMLLLYTFKQLKYRFFLFGVFAIIVMVVTTCLEYYFCRIVFKYPRTVKFKKIIITLTFMYLGLITLIITFSLNKSWNFRTVIAVICQILYSCISFYALYYMWKIRPLNIIEERASANDNYNMDHNNQPSGAYSPEIEEDGSIYIPPEPFYNYDNELITNNHQQNMACSNSNNFEAVSTPNYSENARNLTNGLQYGISTRRTASSPTICAIGNQNSLINDDKETYKRASSFFEDYGILSNADLNLNDISKNYSAQYLDLSTTTGAISEYEMLYMQSEMIDGSQIMCNPYANVCAENII